MENKQYPEIYNRLLPIYKAVATPTWRGNEDDVKISIGTGAGEGRWERNAVGNEGVLILDEYRRNGRNFEPRFSYDLEKHGIRCDHSHTSFLMVLSSVRNKFAEVTGMTFRDWLEAQGERVDHLYDNTATEKKVAFAYKEDTPEDIAERKERAKRLSAEDRSGWKDQPLFGEEETPECKATRTSRNKLEKQYQQALSIGNIPGSHKDEKPKDSSTKSTKTVSKKAKKKATDKTSMPLNNGSSKQGTKKPETIAEKPPKAKVKEPESEMATSFFELGSMDHGVQKKPKFTDEDILRRYEDIMNRKTSEKISALPIESCDSLF